MTDQTTTPTPQTPFVSETALIVAALAQNMHGATAEQVATMVSTIHASFVNLTVAPAPTIEPVAEVRPEPAVSIRASVKNDHIVCLEDGKKFKMLKRHLSTRYNMTPNEYRARWGLPADYPMVAPAYAEKRRDLALTIGLGRKPGQRNKASLPEGAPKVAARRGRPPKVRTEENAAA